MSESKCNLPLPLPTSKMDRMILVILRRMAIHGLRDARAGLLAIHLFGARFRKPLVLLRCYLHELATISRRNISVAPCCAPRMTADEALLLDGLALGNMAAFEALTDTDDVSRAQTTALALRRELISFNANGSVPD